ncbi:MAG TPA: hypothetical protein VJ301_17925 [Propionibacteriaceae bacterium]|nr:hypothetical protein [Propionibacteriaceae bacterium]
MRAQRRPWLLTATLMLASAAAAAWSTYLHWLPCQGRMLRGTIIQPYADGPSYEDFAKLDPADKARMFSCEARMAGDQGPWESELDVVAMVLAGVAWITLVLGLRWQLRTKRVAALPGLATLALAGAMAIGDAVFGRDGGILMILLVGIDLSAVIALIAILAWLVREPDVRIRSFLHLVVVLWGTTAFGASHVMAEYAIMIRFSEANWDSPPGTGYLTVAVITISAVLTAIMALRTPQRGVDDEPHQDHQSGSLTLA